MKQKKIVIIMAGILAAAAAMPGENGKGSPPKINGLSI